MNDPKAKWMTLRMDMLERIKAIDDATPWSETTPGWWHDMRDVENALLRAGGGGAEPGERNGAQQSAAGSQTVPVSERADVKGPSNAD